MNWILTADQWEAAKNALRERRAAVERRYQEDLRAIDDELGALQAAEQFVIRIACQASATVPLANGHHDDAASEPDEASPTGRTQKQMVFAAILAHPNGAPRAHIVRYIHEKFGVDLSPKHVTTYLGRLRDDDRKIRLEGELWKPVAGVSEARTE
jgi:hypothetical protein